MEVKRTELSDMLSVQPRTISDFISKGMPTNGKNGPSARYPLKECIQWYINYKLLETSKSKVVDLDGVAPIEVSEAIEKHWKAQREKNRTLKEDGVLVTVDDAKKELNHHITQIRNALDTIPFSWAPFIVMLSDVDEAQKRLNEQLDTLYNSLSSLPDSDDESVAYEEGPVAEDSNDDD